MGWDLAGGVRVHPTANAGPIHIHTQSLPIHVFALLYLFLLLAARRLAKTGKVTESVGVVRRRARIGRNKKRKENEDLPIHLAPSPCLLLPCGLGAVWH